MRRQADALTAAALALVVAGCGAQAQEAQEPQTPAEAAAPNPRLEPEPEPEPKPIYVQVGLGVSAANAIVGDSLCAGFGELGAPYNSAGPQVVVKDASGAVVGVGELGESEPLDDIGCVRWALVEVPAGGNYYSAEVDGWESTVLPESDLESHNLVIIIDG